MFRILTMSEVIFHQTEASTQQEEKRRLCRSERKRLRHEKLLADKREQRKRRKLERKQRLREGTDSNKKEVDKRLSKRDLKQLVKERCAEALISGQRICIDCGLDDFMSEKEKGKLAQQIGRLYGSNRKAEKPAHIYLTGLKKEGQLYKHCIRKNEGFQNYSIEITDRSYINLFKPDEMVYLSPDSTNILTEVSHDHVYIIGGLVDESVTKNITQSQADAQGIRTARLPIEEYMEKTDNGTFSKILAVNQVFDVLITYKATNDWRQALGAGIPKRKGFVPKELVKL
ncbi:hypothetical protein CHS0354_026689 [Potamilus streckersoni]|uniref:tRNA methyltransferase 10 homolog B n=1 Tax=Potamilus streckersoni TaxID=2493646 RepID=A0AAE0S865_9BIVA|nr:hypothetical protein CHS0354_026689 [Potamilus streckersoni]